MVITTSESRAWTKDHPENLLAALRSSLKEKDVIEIIASSGARILFNKKLLLLFSKTIRKCLADLSCCEPPSSITLVDINIRALKKVKEILENNLYDVTTGFIQEDTNEVVEAAKALGIDMMSVCVSSETGKTKTKKRKKSISKIPKDSLAPARYSTIRKANAEQEVVQLEDEPVTENVGEGQEDDGQAPTWGSGNMDYDDRPLEISVDISSDEEYEAEGEGQGTIFQSSQDTILQNKINDSRLLHEDSDNGDEGEFLQEEGKPESEKISFSFLSGIDGSKTSTEIPPKNNLYELKTEQSEDCTPLTQDRTTIFNQHMSAETEPIVSGPFTEGAQASSDAESELKLRCDLCGKPMKGPSALREHYSITHFFEELFQEYVEPSESHTVCTMDGCNKDYRDRKCLVRHIGSTHNKVNEILERNGIKIPSTGGGVWGGTKRRKSENFAEARSVKIKTEAGESANKSLSRIHQCEVCEKYFSSKHNMERHQKKIHNMPGAGAASGSQLVKEESG